MAKEITIVRESSVNPYNAVKVPNNYTIRGGKNGTRYRAYVYGTKRYVNIEKASSYDDAYKQIEDSGLYGKRPKVRWDG